MDVPSEASEAQLSVLLGRDVLADRVAELGREITAAYRGRSLVLLVVLRGSFVFAADLARAIDLPLRMEFLAVQSYEGSSSSGVVQITQDLLSPIAGEDVLIVEDIVDTGLTSSYLKEVLGTRGPRTLELCALLHKPARAVEAVAIDYLGFTIEDRFVVGYGLDYEQRYRNLPDLCVLAPPGV